MRDYIREQLQREITRKEFLQIMTGVVLSVFGFHNLVNLLSSQLANSNNSSTGNKQTNDSRHGFGSSRFGA